jgi:AAA+ ATPase superfamily predicted ATPase
LTAEQTAGYVKGLTERFQLVERRLPIFARKKERKGRYYVRDNFLRSWLSALASAVAATNFQPTDRLIAQALLRLEEAEGHGFERLAATLYEERSRKGLPGFSLTHRIDGYWDNQGTELDLIAVDATAQRIRFATCKRSPSKLLASLERTEGHIARYLSQHSLGYTVEKVAIAPCISRELREQLSARHWLAEDLNNLVEGL